jgi:hypothetical protein
MSNTLNTPILLGTFLSIVSSSCIVSDDPEDTDSSINTSDIADNVVINEIVAHNESGIMDEAGNTTDWLELYNPTQEAVDLNDWALYDGNTADDPWTFGADVQIAAGEFLIIFCDSDPEEGDLHTDFNLSRQGEVVTLEDHTALIVDSVEFPGLLPDRSWARVPDGSDQFLAIEPPTPGATNGD